MESSYHEHRWTTWFLWKEGIKLSGIHCQLSAICGEKVPVHSTVLNRVQSFNRGKETTQAVVHESYCKTPKKWFHEAILKLPRTWQQ
jgi:hypothetical protein